MPGTDNWTSGPGYLQVKHGGKFLSKGTKMQKRKPFILVLQFQNPTVWLQGQKASSMKVGQMQNYTENQESQS